MKYILAIICALVMTSCATNKVGDMGKTINQLTATDTVVSSDQTVIYVAESSDARKAAMSVLQAYMQANLDFDDDFKPKFVNRYKTPTASGFGFGSVDIITADNTWLILTATETEPTIIITLPGTGGASFVAPADGQELLVISNQIISNITFFTYSPTTIEGEPSDIAADGYFKLKYNALNNKWYRIG